MTERFFNHLIRDTTMKLSRESALLLTAATLAATLTCLVQAKPFGAETVQIRPKYEPVFVALTPEHYKEAALQCSKLESFAVNALTFQDSSSGPAHIWHQPAYAHMTNTPVYPSISILFLHLSKSNYLAQTFKNPCLYKITEYTREGKPNASWIGSMPYQEDIATNRAERICFEKFSPEMTRLERTERGISVPSGKLPYVFEVYEGVGSKKKIHGRINFILECPPVKLEGMPRRIELENKRYK
ncbi:hypothetical protein HYZ97_04285 [Candidatus Pacearchaeota archaeon]|nr:hypothetical protein [Candidatus Pacearchaeota archaeon]